MSWNSTILGLTIFLPTPSEISISRRGPANFSTRNFRVFAVGFAVTKEMLSKLPCLPHTAQ
jgi:hypothetical protein